MGRREGVQRILAEIGMPGLVDALVELPGSDITTLMLEVMRRRAAAVSPAQLVRQHIDDRFVQPARIAYSELRRVEELLLDDLPAGFEPVVLSPLVPLGTHAAVAPVDQNKVVTTLRRAEVAADPTNGLALEAAVRRQALLRADSRSPARVRLAACQRVVRAQRFSGAAAFAHFHLFGLVTAGRDTGNLSFERECVTEHLSFLAHTLLVGGAEVVRIETSDFTRGAMGPVDEAVRSALAKDDQVKVLDRPDRSRGRGYYDRFCFTVFSSRGGRTLEVADGGLVGWSQQLVASRKERLLISGIGVERVADITTKA